MKQIVFLGSKKIGLLCLKILFNNRDKFDYKIAGVLTNTRGTDIKDYCEMNSLNLLSNLDEYLVLEKVDIVISVQYHEILKQVHINKATEIIVNLHMAPLPEYRGCNQFSFALLDGKSEFGTTIHRLEAGIDNGSIIREKRFKIPENFWVEDLYNLTFDKSIELFSETLPMLIKGDYTLTPQDSLFENRTTSLHFRKEINDLKVLDLSWPKEKIEQHIRATYMPGFLPPYFILDGKKLYVNIEGSINDED